MRSNATYKISKLDNQTLEAKFALRERALKKAAGAGYEPFILETHAFGSPSWALGPGRRV